MRKAFYIFLFGGILSLFFAGVSLALAPDAPELYSPDNGDTNVSVTPTFRWESVGAQEYRLYFGNKRIGDLTGSSYKVKDDEALFPSTLYSWHVKACNPGSGQGIFDCSDSETRSFTTEAKPAAPTLLSPRAGETNVSLTPTFRWSDVGAGWYHLYFDGSVRSNLTGTSYTFGSGESLSPGTGYAWNVRACSSNPEGGAALCSDSRTWTFTTVSASAPAPTPAPSPSPPGGLVCPGQMADCPDDAICIPNPLCADTLEELLGAITDFIRNLALVVAPIMLVISGLLFVTSAGDPGRVQTAKKLALYTVIGFVIILIASGLIDVLKSVIGTR